MQLQRCIINNMTSDWYKRYACRFISDTIFYELILSACTRRIQVFWISTPVYYQHLYVIRATCGCCALPSSPNPSLGISSKTSGVAALSGRPGRGEQLTHERCQVAPPWYPFCPSAEPCGWPRGFLRGCHCRRLPPSKHISSWKGSKMTGWLVLVVVFLVDLKILDYACI